MIETYLNEDGNLVFTYASRMEKEVRPVLYRDDEAVYAMRMAYEQNNKIQRDFLKHIAQKGHLDKIFPKSVVRAALTRGARPRNYQVHHIVPLCCGGSNDFSNLMLVHKDVHAEIHDRIWKGIYKTLKSGIKQRHAFVDLPKLPPVMVPEDKVLLLSLEELRRLLAKDKCKRAKIAYHNDQPNGHCITKHTCYNIAPSSHQRIKK